MTSALYRKAKRSPTGVISLTAFVEGPYGGLENLRSYGTVVLFAGGVGITHQLSHIHDLLSAFADGTCATRKVLLVWSVRTSEQLGWVKPWMDELLDMSNRGNDVRIELYVTRSGQEEKEPAIMKELGLSPRISYGRMHVGDIIEKEFQERVGAMSISVCGPGGLADDVRAASRAMMGRGNVDFWEESFSW